MHSKSFFFKGHRGGDMLTRDEWKVRGARVPAPRGVCATRVRRDRSPQVWKAYFHISDPADAPKFGTPAWDELHKVRPMLDVYLQRCVDNISDHGRRFSIDEITIGFQGHHARLKQRCGKFKRAGDGFQVHRRRARGG